MFQNHARLQGNDFKDRYSKLKRHPRQAYDKFRRLVNAFRPDSWVDKLTHDQELSYAFVRTKSDWNEVCHIFRDDLQDVPLLSVAVEMRDVDPRFISISSYVGHTITFCVEALKELSPGWLTFRDALPPDIFEWMAEPHVFVLTSGQTDLLTDPGQFFCANNVVDTEQMFSLYRDLGVVRPNPAPRCPDLAYQMTLVFHYHHRPMELPAFQQLVPNYEYVDWPHYRDPSWTPETTTNNQASYEQFYLFYQSVGPLAFTYRLIMHGIIFGGMRAVQGELPFDEMLSVFLRGNVSAGQRDFDPLRLQSDAPVNKNRQVLDLSPGLESPSQSRQRYAASSPTSPSSPIINESVCSPTSSSSRSALLVRKRRSRHDISVSLKKPEDPRGGGGGGALSRKGSDREAGADA